MSRDDALERLRTAEWLTRARPFFDALGGREGRTRAVGGIVRDTLLGLERADSDIDLATEFLPQEVVARAEAAGLSAYPTGIDHGTVTLVHGNQTAEVTTLRSDVETFGRQARVAFGTDWMRDARRRDFTMNALYASPDGVLFDPLESLEDCLALNVQFIGDPDARIHEDRLRVYRYFRFVATRGNQRVDPAAVDACARWTNALDALSAERVGGEMMRLLAAPHCASTLQAMSTIGLLDRALFTREALDALARHETQITIADGAERLGLLAATGAPIEDLRGRWRLSNAVMDRGLDLARAASLARSAQWVELGYRHGAEADAAIAIAAAIDNQPSDWVETGRLAVRTYVDLVFPISGADLLAQGLGAGPALGATLRRLERAWLDSYCTLGRAELLALV